MKHDTTGGAHLPQSIDQLALTRYGSSGRRRLLRTHNRCRPIRSRNLDLIGERRDIFIQPLLLLPARALAAELRPIEIGLVRKAARANHQITKTLATLHAIHSGAREFALETHIFGLLCPWNANVGVREHCNHVPRLQNDV